MKNKYQIGEKFIVISTNYSEMLCVSGKMVEIIPYDEITEFDYKVKYQDGTVEFLNHDELKPIESQKTLNSLIIDSPTFNLSELLLGSLLYINKGYLQLQGFIAAITPFRLTLGYYDELSQIILSLETADIEDVVSGKHTIELIRKAIPLELQGI